MLNFSRNGTRASAGVSQMTMPSRYRSLIAVPAAAGPVGAETPAPSAAGVAVGSGVADCPDADTVQNSTDTNATATLTSFTSTPGNLASYRRGNSGLLVELAREPERGALAISRARPRGRGQLR